MRIKAIKLVLNQIQRIHGADYRGSRDVCLGMLLAFREIEALGDSDILLLEQRLDEAVKANWKRQVDLSKTLENVQ